jgi:outer membrane protein OmpA-like peptidoglycan-associated protein
MKKTTVFVLVLALLIGSVGCSTLSQQEKGAAAGAGIGGVIGGIIGKQLGNTTAGVFIGAAIGGAAGAYIGNYMDKQAAEMERDLEGATIERVGDGIMVTFDSGILFEVNKAELSDAAKENLARLSEILLKYEDTDILIEGHTDSDGSDAYNQGLSESRASSVANYLVWHKVVGERLTTTGYGESQPIAPNETSEGKSLNRRVEVAIKANDKLKKAAERQTGS